MEDLKKLGPLTPELRLTLVAAGYRKVAGQAQGFDPVVHASELLGQGDVMGAMREVVQLELLTKNLLDIAVVRPKIAAKLRSRLMRRAGDFSNYVGWRTEARIASSLARARLAFEYDDAPDFIVEMPGGAVALECTSAHVDSTTAVDRDLGYKIATAVRKKGRMSYADGSLCVAVDISGILSRGRVRHVSRDDHDLILKAATQDPVEGSALLFATTFNPTTGDVRFRYSRHDTDAISPALKLFLDTQYPRGAQYAEGIIFA